MEYKRSDRIADLLQKEIADLVFRRVKDPRVTSVTISGVDVTADLKHARVYYCVMGSPTEEEKQSVAQGLNKAKGFIRQELGKRLYIRYVPQITFCYDQSFEYGDKIERILKGLHENE
ncbi:30S ribosome-binding factor RbfA [Desulforhabdus amnigena]|uniref:Ribosome-binding factor A n=1 Tax=Desulforhabdus amnigena TaxID=40218 RepID=A0A9W6D5S8_9BACT|nr:30S ribosome-binding factor RbfA [Desulforhabdus amnigena]NLJ29843.1 30S ribosome-binding factor RbfA [Deltaproteobacteria bacterium]GLI33881.1 ribosome-binding factor A [Desulforhabdus amnigena]